jgi:MoaA/NifB/PqqE/SkfB family radical SAM enzyme
MGIMDLQLFKSLVDELEGKVEAISLASRGEPTINKMLPEMLNYLEGKFLAVKVNTNASLLDETISRAILDADIQTLVFSADAAVEPLYSQLRVGGSLDKITQNIERFHKLKNKHYSDSRLITRVSGVYYQDEQKIEDMEAYWKDLVDQVAFVDYNPWENVYDADKKGITQPCSDLWRRMFIWWDGKVAPCDVDYLTKLSNETVLDKSISKIWNGEMYQELRSNHLSGRRGGIEPCSRCVVV